MVSGVRFSGVWADFSPVWADFSPASEGIARHVTYNASENVNVAPWPTRPEPLMRPPCRFTMR